MFGRVLMKRTVILILLFLVSTMLNACLSPGTKGPQKASITPTPTLIQASPDAKMCSGLKCSTPPSVIRPFIDTSNNIHRFQSFDYHISDPAAVASFYDFVWGVTPSKVAAFRAAHPDILLSYYISFHTDSGTFTDPELAKKQYDLNYWKSLHPDWILYKCDRVTPALEYKNPNIPLDFSNPALVAWQVQTYALPASQHGYDAIAADSLNLENLFGACGFYRNGQWVQRYTGAVSDPQWEADVVSWLTRMQAALHALPHPLALIPNLGFSNSSLLNNATLQQVVSHVDAILDERGFTNYGHSYETGDNWLQIVQFIKSVQQQNKAYYITNQFPAGFGQAQREWALASYLLSNESLASVFISGVQDYGRVLYYSEYSAPIGTPRGEMYQSDRVYWRDYSGGLVAVNPDDTQSYTVKTSYAGYKDLSGNPVSQSFTLPPHSGKILLA